MSKVLEEEVNPNPSDMEGKSRHAPVSLDASEESREGGWERHDSFALFGSGPSAAAAYINT